MDHLRVSPWLAFGLVCAACVAFLCVNAYHSDPEDTSWTDRDVPPEMAPITFVPGLLAPDTAPGGVGDPIRHRRYPTSLVSASASIIGTF